LMWVFKLASRVDLPVPMLPSIEIISGFDILIIELLFCFYIYWDVVFNFLDARSEWVLWRLCPRKIEYL